MMLGIGLGIMAILCAIGLIAGGGLLMHHGPKSEQKEDQPVIQQDHRHGQTAESSPDGLNEDQKIEDLYPGKKREGVMEEEK